MKLNHSVTIECPWNNNDLRRWRVERGIGLREFCRELGVTSSYWSKVERGLTRPDWLTCLRAVALILNFHGKVAI